MGFELTSAAFRQNEPIPKEHSCEGADTSVPLAWKDSPANSKAFALIMDDPDAPGRTFVHWVIYDLPPDTRSLATGVSLDEKPESGGTQGKNDFGKVGYGGPCPPPGPAHHYHFKLYALDRPTGLPPKATRQQLLGAMKGQILGEAELVGTFKR